MAGGPDAPALRGTGARRRPAVAVRAAADEAEVTAAGELTAEAYQADRLVAPRDAYLTELADARRRAAEGVLLVAVLPEHDAVVGTITLAPYGTSYAETAEPGELELRMLAVAPEARGRGVAEALMRASMREAVLRGHRRVVLATMTAMTTAQRLYERLGWQRDTARDWSHEGVHLLVYTWSAPPGPGAGLERATWPPVRSEEVGGFTLGLADGVTRRANSAVLSSARWHDLTEEVLADRLSRVEAAYRLAGLRPCVRADHDAVLADEARVTDVLVARGYRLVTPTFVLVREIAAGKPVDAPAGEAPEGWHVALTDAPDAPWLDTWLGPDAEPAHRATGRAILTGVPARYATVGGASGTVLGVARLAVRDRWAGIAALTVRPEARGRGIGRALASAVLAEAGRLGAERAFAQVRAGNDAALTMLEGLGFEVAAAYSYAERDAY